MRFEHAGQTGFGCVEGAGTGADEKGSGAEQTVHVHRGDLFASPQPTGERLPLSAVKCLTPCVPSQFLGIGYNSRAIAEKQGTAPLALPFYFLKAPGAQLAPGAELSVPRSYSGRVVFEGELGVVIGKRARDLSVVEAGSAIFGYTCINDVTALDLITAEPPQWTRAKGFPGFGPFGPVVVTGLDPATLQVRTLVNGKERQNYAVSDLVFSPAEIVSHLSRDLELQAGDVIACGTSLGVGAWKPGTTVEVEIAGIGVLRNTLSAS
jgi:2-keto-4-pentenoate hydratase/2-oxohepta-3-ene-1,7-dioic acid hydratase in catechol pathway